MIETFTNTSIATIMAISIVGIAIVAVQNARLVRVNWVNLQSIELPWGIALALALALGWLLGALLPALGRAKKSRSN
jgi:uncharacterized integral membrane protein